MERTPMYVALHVHAFTGLDGSSVVVSLNDVCGHRQSFDWQSGTEPTPEQWSAIRAKVVDLVEVLREAVQQPFAETRLAGDPSAPDARSGGR